MKKRRNADEVARLLRDVDRDLAKGLTVSDACRKIDIAETTSYRWRQRQDPAVVDADRRCREQDGATTKNRPVRRRGIGAVPFYLGTINV